MAFEDILWAQGSQNMGGIVDEIYFVPIDDVDDSALPAIGTAGDLILSGNITLKALKKFFKIYHTMETGVLNINNIGEIDGMSVEAVLEFFIPGLKEAEAKFQRQVINTSGLWLVGMPEGDYRVLGLSILDPTGTATSLALHAKVQTGGGGTTGQARADRKGNAYQVVFRAPHAPLYYTGTIDTDDAT